MTNPLLYRVGDATVPVAPRVFITHVVNSVGAWGRGFTQPLTARYPGARESFLGWSRETPREARLGRAILWMQGDLEVGVIHLCAQDGLPGRENPRPLSLPALASALREAEKIVQLFQQPGSQAFRVQMPRIGVGLARGNWVEIEPLIVDTLGRVAQVTVLDPLKPAAPVS